MSENLSAGGPAILSVRIEGGDNIIAGSRIEWTLGHGGKEVVVRVIPPPLDPAASMKSDRLSETPILASHGAVDPNGWLGGRKRQKAERKAK